MNNIDYKNHYDWSNRDHEEVTTSLYEKELDKKRKAFRKIERCLLQHFSEYTNIIWSKLTTSDKLKIYSRFFVKKVFFKKEYSKTVALKIAYFLKNNLNYLSLSKNDIREIRK